MGIWWAISRVDRELCCSCCGSVGNGLTKDARVCCCGVTTYLLPSRDSLSFGLPYAKCSSLVRDGVSKVLASHRIASSSRHWPRSSLFFIANCPSAISELSRHRLTPNLSFLDCIHSFLVVDEIACGASVRHKSLFTTVTMPQTWKDPNCGLIERP